MTTDMDRLSVYFGGEVYWIGIGVATGVVVGGLKAYVLKFDAYKGFIEIIQELGKFCGDIQTYINVMLTLLFYASMIDADLKEAGKITIHCWDAFLDMGNCMTDHDLQSRQEKIEPGHCCGLIYTSGTAMDCYLLHHTHPHHTTTPTPPHHHTTHYTPRTTHHAQQQLHFELNTQAPPGTPKR